MATVTVTISLPESLKEFIDHQVEQDAADAAHRFVEAVQESGRSVGAHAQYGSA
jgi:hypothetical protein